MPSLPSPLAALHAASRLLRIGGLILSGLWQVRWRLPGLPAAERDQRVQRWATALLRVLRVQVRASGVQAAGGGAGGRLLVANHISWLDIVVLQSLSPQATFLSKADVRRWPLVGSLVAGAGTLFIDRRDRRAVAQARDELARRLRAGGTLVVFPEGTTSDGRTVLPFRAGLLQAALQAGVRVQPLALRYRDPAHSVSPHVPYIGEESFVANLWRLCCAEGVVALVQGLPAQDAASIGRRALADALHACIVAALGAGGGVEAAGNA